MAKAFALLAASCALVAGCAASPAMLAADHGDRAALRDALGARERAGTLSNAEAASLAERVAGRELLAATPAEAPERVRDALPCARELDGPLADRMRVHDAAGADAALARVAGRGLGLDDARAFATDPDPRWRAVSARALVRPQDHEARLRALLDDDPGVRREAARAARDAADPADFAALAEAARVDPEPIVRTEAVRALAALPAPAAGPSVAERLRDLWTSGDDGLREDVALAWASGPVWSAGGREALRVLVASGHGPGAVEGAAAVLRHPDVDAETAQAAIGLLARSIAGGSRATRLQALAQAPLDCAELLAAVRAAAADDDLEIRTGALGRLATSANPDAAERVRALAALEGLGQPGSPVAPRARYALATVGDRRIQGWLEASLSAPDPFDCLGAATALASLGVASRAAPLLADGDAGVRVRSACTILQAARVSR